MANPLEAGFSEDHRGKIRKPPRESVIRNIISPAIEEDRAHGSFQDYLDINKAHVLMLARQGIISEEVEKAILTATDRMAAMGPEPDFPLDPKLEDMYFNLERHLIEMTSLEIGGQQHTARSRNDLFATSARMAYRRYYFAIAGRFIAMRKAIHALAEKNKDAVFSGYTHLQPSEPITFAHYLSAILASFERDYRRFSDAYRTLDRSPLGGGSMGSTTWNIDRGMTADLLGFSEVIDNSIDCVASRDYGLDIASGMAAAGNTLSRFCFDLYIWATPDYGYVEVDDSDAVCSSIMPQKKNPWTLEHIKGKAAHLEAAWISVFSAMKNTPYTHCQDVNGEALHWLWPAMREMEACLEMMTDTVSGLKFNKERALETARGNFCTAAELANTIVRHDHISFRTAHEIVAEVVNRMIAGNLKADETGLSVIAPVFRDVVGRETTMTEDDVRSGLDPKRIAMAKRVTGGTAPDEVARQLESRLRAIESDDAELAHRIGRVADAKAKLEREVHEVIG
ncbi:argininosuccinate lyase [Mesosutterella multiformis]|jgi:argininosuccinate lyase|uniref:Argininosuccinate lyase n=1 Tax=Mesosutterella multiformis TaxID=2259133 RepID=A0A388SGB5_9BURK|nr:argininosuccinate lyase [Mesosutterella multiformis]RGU74143.1 argininosuccinate lyase [Sutterella sp. AF15-45LB]RGU74911.1 argininosuccinate lyase [Sutterella sp. AF15-44LB]RHH04318.1 argininosuccinate lyase [Sutterella sp. AM18-8-1]GBO94480.1 argininosuccinate lyase [Mesosutterella multiformis]GCB31352.1 argininosuccinate lyase [Mesosutterella multiformis]